MGMFDNAMADHERGLHIASDTSGVCPYCEGEVCEECQAQLKVGEEHEEGCSKPAPGGDNGRYECPACGVPIELAHLINKVIVDAVEEELRWRKTNGHE